MILVICSESKKCKLKFTLSIKNKPNISEKSYIEVEVRKEGEHEHKDNEAKQLRGDLMFILIYERIFTKKIILGSDRLEVVEDIMLNSNGSGKHYVNKLVTDLYLANEDVPDYETSKKMENVVRKALQEYNNREMVYNYFKIVLIKTFELFILKPSTNWITNLQYVAKTCRMTLESSKLKGYVQKLEVKQLRLLRRLLFICLYCRVFVF